MKNKPQQTKNKAKYCGVMIFNQAQREWVATGPLWPKLDYTGYLSLHCGYFRLSQPRSAKASKNCRAMRQDDLNQAPATTEDDLVPALQLPLPQVEGRYIRLSPF